MEMDVSTNCESDYGNVLHVCQESIGEQMVVRDGGLTWRGAIIQCEVDGHTEDISGRQVYVFRIWLKCGGPGIRGPFRVIALPVGDHFDVVCSTTALGTHARVKRDWKIQAKELVEKDQERQIEDDKRIWSIRVANIAEAIRPYLGNPVRYVKLVERVLSDWDGVPETLSTALDSRSGRLDISAHDSGKALIEARDGDRYAEWLQTFAR